MPKSKEQKYRIIIRGRSFDADSFKQHDFEQAEISHVADGIRQLVVDSRAGVADPVDLVDGSPLLHVEGLIRYQWLQLECCKTGQITLEDLLTSSDVIREQDHVDSLNCTKTSFYYRFLRNVVYLSETPRDIWEGDIERICEAMAGMHSYIQPSLNASKKRSTQKRTKEKLIAAYFEDFILGAARWTREDIENSTISKIANKIYFCLSNEHDLNRPEIGVIDVNYDDQTKVISYPDHKKESGREGINRKQLETKLRKIRKEFLS